MRLPGSVYNPLSIMGAIIAGVSLFFILVLIIISLLFSYGGSYLGLFIYIVLPFLSLIGLLLIPLGMLFKVKKTQKANRSELKRWITIDLNQANHRNAFFVFFFGGIVFFLLTGIGSYEAFHYSESVEFCGLICHEVMEPEYTTYKYSPHAHVACVKCHVGPGANWFVRSKLSGLYQVYAITVNNYSKPLGNPLTNLRQARETCEQCHWPKKFYSNKLKYKKHYLSDSINTEWNIHLRMKIGADHSAQGLKEGIHWHINPDVRIEYISESPTQETIPWVRYINTAKGDTLIYQDTDFPLDSATIASTPPEVMDCMDCHNRPSHIYNTPAAFVDGLIAAGYISEALPRIKHIAMEMLKEDYPSADSALVAIESGIMAYYRAEHPELLNGNGVAVRNAITAIKSEYKKNIFPHMEADWDAYTDHISHVVYNGCFRCHNNLHTTLSGKAIRQDCNLCHTIMLQGPRQNPEVAPFDGFLEFRHPVDIDRVWKESLCSDCHRYLYL